MKKKNILLIGLFLAGGMLLQTSVQAAVLSIPAAALLPRGPGVIWETNGTRMAAGAGMFTQFFQAPVFLPHNAVITKIILEGKDVAAVASGGFIEVSLMEFGRYNVFGRLATLATNPLKAPGDFRKAKALNHTVDNWNYSYGLEVKIDNAGDINNVWYYKVVIIYTH